MYIRIAEHKDVPELTELFFQWANEMGLDVNKNEVENELFSLRKDGVVLLAETSCETVGMLGGAIAYYFWSKEHIAQEKWFFVKPINQGEGIGKALGAAFLGWAKGQGADSVLFNVTKYGTMNIEKAARGLKKYDFETYGYVLRREI